MQYIEETTVTVASKALKVGERGIYHAKHVRNYPLDKPDELKRKGKEPNRARKKAGYEKDH